MATRTAKKTVKKKTAAKKKSVIAIFCSGQGTNLQAILDAHSARKIKADIGIVISDNESAKALQRAKKAGIEAVFVDPKSYASRWDYELELLRLLDDQGVDLVCLAGFMRILSPVFVTRYRGRILNVHPSLLPAFPGKTPVADALSWGVKYTGVTVHLVDEQVDHGPVLVQEPVAVQSTDNEARLLARIHKVEHVLYVKAIQMMLSGKVRIIGRQIKVTG